MKIMANGDAVSNRNSIMAIVTTGIMIAMTFLATYFTHIPTPIPGGYFNLGDAVIMAAAITLGRTSGFFAGAVGSCLADIAFGGFLFAPITFIVKGLEGFVAGTIANSGFLSSNVRRIMATVAGAVIMVGGYFLAEAYLLGFIDKSFGMAAAVAELVPNIIQGSISAIVAFMLSMILEKIIGKNKHPGFN